MTEDCFGLLVDRRSAAAAVPPGCVRIFWPLPSDLCLIFDSGSVVELKFVSLSVLGIIIKLSTSLLLRLVLSKVSVLFSL